ncbi:beta-mannosidase-like [Teleopsis dalmanni]|uniref:beta-mannosidase-like n=1 Tax=Teleopsis dalmanni TaxID=139649 RepID=UPI0018CEA6AC|nr:beta-mannosidase-like [Teleopsis dalmanni]
MHKLNNFIAIIPLLFLGYDKFISCDEYEIRDLYSNWSLKNQSSSTEIVVGRLPVGVYTALKSQYGDVLDSKNDVDLRWIAKENWTFTNKFSLNKSEYQSVRCVNLTLHGVDTVANIRLNGKVIGTTNNMFVRYSFNVIPYLQEENTLEIQFLSPLWAANHSAAALEANNINTPPKCPNEREKSECHRNMLRKMQASFGSGWNPAVPSVGIWKPVHLEAFDVAIMRDVDIAINRNDTHWIMDIRVFLSTGVKENFYGELMLYAPELLDQPLNTSRQDLNYVSPILELEVPIPKEKVELWWPNGYGAQKLYPLLFSMNCWIADARPKRLAKTISKKVLHVGFRTIELVENLDVWGRTFYFKVNGHPIFMKGANYMPVHILPELSADERRMRYVLKAAKQSHMNMIRVWAGGLYESDTFYNTADEFGLLVWQDMTFSDATYPVTDEFVESVRVEAVQNAKRISYHPSLAIIVTNNEIEWYLTRNRTDFGYDAERLDDEYKKLFLGTIKHELNVITRQKFSPRPGPMMSTPSIGVEEVKKDIPADPQTINYGDVHFFEDEKDGCNPDIYPRARFVSEYGWQSLPVMSSWNRTLGTGDTVVGLMKHRQHDPKYFGPMMQLIARHLPFKPSEWENDVENFVYFSQVAQAMAVKTATELFRSQRAHNHTMGAIYWQLNDVWVAPTWSSIDYYGNFKILYYWSKNFLKPYAIFALYDSKNKGLNITLVRDEVTEQRDARVYDVTMNTFLWSKLYLQKNITWQFILESNSISQNIKQIDDIIKEPYNVNNCFLEFVLSEPETGNILASTWFFPSTVSKAIGLVDPEIKATLSSATCTSSKTSYSLTILVNYPALFVYIELQHHRIVNYTLSDNGFVQVVPAKMVHIEYQETECITITMANIKILTMNQFMSGTTSTSGSATTSTTTTTAMPSDTTVTTASPITSSVDIDVDLIS